MAKSQKTEKVNKNRKKLKFEKKPSRGIALRNVCTKFGADWNIFRYRNDDTTESVTESQTHKLLVISLLGRSEMPRKKISAHSEKIT